MPRKSAKNCGGAGKKCLLGELPAVVIGVMVLHFAILPPDPPEIPRGSGYINGRGRADSSG
ncbi:MAG: hypothetical protein KBA96_00450 [Rhodocyclaceae bacterium]|nr:hypothetical protein [Rhodocyclaceae bacterium]